MIKYKKVAAMHRYYKITKFYLFLRGIAIKGGLTILGFVAILVALEIFFIDIDALLNTLVANYSPLVVFSTFLLSETILGLLPPEIFIAWSSKSATPWLFLFVIATLSYIGGVIAYYFGQLLFLIPSVRLHIETKIAGHISNLRRWGGLFVFVGAMLPLPHSIVSLACGVINYHFGHYLLWALFRYLRFLIYGVIIFQVF